MLKVLKNGQNTIKYTKAEKEQKLSFSSTIEGAEWIGVP